MPHTPSLRGAQRRSNPDCLRGKILDCFAALAMTECDARTSFFNSHFRLQTRHRNPAARFARVALPSCAPNCQRAQGRPGAGWHPSPYAREMHTGWTTGLAGRPAFPARLVLTVSFVLSPGSDALLPPSPCSLVRHEGPVGPHASPQRLGASNRTPGPHDFAVRRFHRSLCAKVPLTAQPPCRTKGRADDTRVHRHPARVS